MRFTRAESRLNSFFIAAVFALLAGCAVTPAREGAQTEIAPAAQPNVSPEAQTGAAPDDRLNATLWMQEAVEYKANTRTVYALAKLRLGEALADKTWTAVPKAQQAGYEKLPPAIILDADETVLDNSPYQAMMVKTGAGYTSASWKAWANAAKAGAVPGAVEFTNEAAAAGVTVFYVTNRSADLEEGTTRNLSALGFPMKEGEDTVMTRGEKPDWTSKKGTRRATVAEHYRVLLLLGDNFGDFTDDYAGSPEERRAVYDANKAHWGRDWLMLPNPAYGSWESAAFGGDYSLSPEEQRRRKIDRLNAWAPGR